MYDKKEKVCLVAGCITFGAYFNCVGMLVGIVVKARTQNVSALDDHYMCLA